MSGSLVLSLATLKPGILSTKDKQVEAHVGRGWVGEEVIILGNLVLTFFYLFHR